MGVRSRWIRGERVREREIFGVIRGIEREGVRGLGVNGRWISRWLKERGREGGGGRLGKRKRYISRGIGVLEEYGS